MHSTSLEQPTRDQPGKRRRAHSAGLAVAIAILVSACGSGGDGASSGSASVAPASAPAPAAGTGAASAPSNTASNASPAPSGGAATGSGAQTTSTSGSASGSDPVTGPTPFATELLQRVNAIRASAHTCGTTSYPAAAPLAWNTSVEDAARVQALYLQGNNLFSHTGANGSSVADRLSATGYAWSAVGENIAAGYPDAAAVVAGWFASPGHCANLSNAGFADLGVVLQPGTSTNTYPTYWVMVVAHAR